MITKWVKFLSLINAQQITEDGQSVNPIDRIEEIETMRLWRTPRQVVAEEIEDDGLRRVLDSLAIALEKQESQKNGQPLLDSYNLRADGVGLVGQRSNA